MAESKKNLDMFVSLKMQQDSEQARAALKEFAGLAKLYYDELKAGGFDDSIALYLTNQLQAQMIATALVVKLQKGQEDKEDK